MTEKLEGFDQYLTLAGFRNVKIPQIENFLSEVKIRAGETCVQFFDADSIAGFEHLRLAAVNALTAFRDKVAISNSVAMEALLYASAQHQIKDSLRLLGITAKSRRIAVLILTETRERALAILSTISELLQGERDDRVIEFTKEKTSRMKKLFGISALEVEAKTDGKQCEEEILTDLIIEHMALLVTHR